MTILYDLVSADTIQNLSIGEKKDFMFEIIMSGSFEYFEKFRVIFENGDITQNISSTEILEALPMVIDPKLFQYLLETYEFEQGQHFFYNYAIHNENPTIKVLVYNYFVDNHSHIMLDNMSKYEQLIEK